jgi:hypothetical protein
MTKTAGVITAKTGLDFVVRPIQEGISSGVGHVSSGVGHMSSVAGSMTSHMISLQAVRRRHSLSDGLATRSDHTASKRDLDMSSYRIPNERSPGYQGGGRTRRESCLVHPNCESGSNTDCIGPEYTNFEPSVITHGDQLPTFVSDPLIFNDGNDEEELDPALAFPEQNIDIQGPSTGKKLTDDLAEIKDKMNELTWHLFDDRTFVVRNPNSLFFGDSKKPEKRRKADATKKLDKYLHMGQYSHSNPFVARVGMYVEPILGCTYSILCLFRACFNVVTWRDPMLSFWLSFFCLVAALVLFIFPWRLFLFVLGMWLVGPQNLAIRILRERGHLPPAPKFSSRTDDTTELNPGDALKLPSNKPIFSRESRRTGNDVRNNVDPTIDLREVHEIVVPYSPLCYQRCNDWPPEPQYAQVKRATPVQDLQKRLGDAYNIRRNASHASGSSGITSSGNVSNSRSGGTLRRRQRLRTRTHST